MTAHTRLHVRLPDRLARQFEMAVQERDGSPSAAAREAIELWLDEERRQRARDDMEARLASTMNQLRSEVRQSRNELNICMAFIDQLAQTYLLHTPPIPADAIDAAVLSGTDRHKKLVRNLVMSLQGDGPAFLRAAEDAIESGEKEA